MNKRIILIVALLLLALAAPLYLISWLSPQYLPAPFNNSLVLLGVVIMAVFTILANLKDTIELVERYILGRSSAGGGSGVTVVQGNQSVTNIITQYGTVLSPANRDDLIQQVTQYLAWVVEEYGHIELRGIKRDDKQLVQLDLETVYVPLTVRAYQPVTVKEEGGSGPDGRPNDPRAEQPVDIEMEQLLSIGQRLIIIGGPGSGKTTVLLHIAWSLAQAINQDNADLAASRLGLTGDLPLPIFVPLGAYALYLRNLPSDSDPAQRTLLSFIPHYLIHTKNRFELSTSFFTDQLQQGRSVILLLDGLDEVPNEADRVRVREEIESLVTGRGQMRVVVTCRTAAHQGRTALGRGFREVQVKPLEDEHIRDLVQQAYRCIYRLNPGQQAEKSQELWQGIEHLEQERRRRLGKDVTRLIDSPLLVRLLLIVHYSERRRLPEHRAELYMKATEVMLLPDYGPDQQVADRISVLVGPDWETHREMVQYLAFHMHQQRGEGDEQGREISEDGLRQILGSDPVYANLTSELISLTRLRGTLLEERMGTYRFLHLAFQEYLAARYLAEVKRGEGGVEAIVAFLEDGPLLDSWWREVALLIPGYLVLTSPRTAHLFLERLAGLDEGAAARVRSAELDMAAVEIAATAFGEWHIPRPDLQQKVIERLVHLLTDKETAVVTPPQRRAAVGVALARLGDPRPEVMDVDQMQFCYVPAGAFWMGSDDGEDREKPQHWVAMGHNYWLCRFPVTNAQYEQFVADGGYGVARYWAEAKEVGVWRDGGGERGF